VVLIIRGEEKIIPKGKTYVLAGDKIILCGRAGNSVDGVSLSEIKITKEHQMCSKLIKDISKENEIIVMIKRGKSLIIPHGDTKILENDIIVISKND
jgi:cell volume regulation protein A